MERYVSLGALFIYHLTNILLKDMSCTWTTFWFTLTFVPVFIPKTFRLIPVALLCSVNGSLHSSRLTYELVFSSWTRQSKILLYGEIWTQFGYSGYNLTSDNRAFVWSLRIDIELSDQSSSCPLIRSWGCSLNRSSSCSLTRRSSCPPTRPPAQGWDPPPLGRRSTSPPKGRCQILETCTGCAKVMIVEYRSILWHTFSSSKKWLLSGSGCWCGIGYLTQNWPKINNVIVKMMMIYILWCSVCLFVCHEKSSLP